MLWTVFCSLAKGLDGLFCRSLSNSLFCLRLQGPFDIVGGLPNILTYMSLRVICLSHEFQPVLVHDSQCPLCSPTRCGEGAGKDKPACQRDRLGWLAGMMVIDLAGWE